jgi:NADPH:quinone reductase-like Zn-dependent oxidoreductase
VKAIVYHEYGAPDILKCEEIEKPTVGDEEVLIRVRAASVNPRDWHFMRGAPYMIRIITGLQKPEKGRLGVDLAGQVEAVGRNVTQFQPGDQIFGASLGAFAEYVCANQDSVAFKPANLTFEQAAAMPTGGLTALQALRKGRIQPGQKVLINGAAGGVGTFAVPIAKSFGANVTGVCSTRNVDLVRSIGADDVIDYTHEDFTKSGQRYDLMFDCVGNHSLAACRRVMSPKGTYLMVGGSGGGRWMGPLAHGLRAVLLSRFVSQNLVLFFTSPSKKDLVALQELAETGKVTPVIDRTYPLSEIPEAIRYLEEGHARGKVVIALSN